MGNGRIQLKSVRTAWPSKFQVSGGPRLRYRLPDVSRRSHLDVGGSNGGDSPSENRQVKWDVLPACRNLVRSALHVITRSATVLRRRIGGLALALEARPCEATWAKHGPARRSGLRPSSFGGTRSEAQAASPGNPKDPSSILGVASPQPKFRSGKNVSQSPASPLKILSPVEGLWSRVAGCQVSRGLRLGWTPR